MIIHKNNKWVVMDSTGTKVLGTHPSKDKASKQLAAIEISKHAHLKENKVKNFKEYLEEVTALTLQYHDTLNPLLWENDTLKKEIQDKLIEIAQTWIDWAGIPAKSVKDLILVGGNANFNYTEHSDIDVHILIDKSKLANCPELLDDYLKDKKELWNLTHNIKVHDHDVELYAQDSEAEFPVDQGVYSLLNSKWIAHPTHQDINYDNPHVIKKIDEYSNKIETLISGNAEDEAFEKLKTKFKNMRVSGLKRGGEFSNENLIFKELRNRGYFDRMNDYIKSKQDERLSI